MDRQPGEGCGNAMDASGASPVVEAIFKEKLTNYGHHSTEKVAMVGYVKKNYFTYFKQET